MGYRAQTMKTTLREQLNVAGFDWSNGDIVYRRPEPIQDANRDDFNQKGYVTAWLPSKISTTVAYITDEVLDASFDTGFGSPEMPSFLAKDNKFIYYPAQYDGATWVEKSPYNLKELIGSSCELPYPGGS